MDYSPLGAVCHELGLMTESDIHQVLGQLAEGVDVRFGALALQLGLLDEAGLVKALAHQYSLNLIPAERLEQLEVPPEVLERVPRALIRRATLLPFRYDAEHDVLSVLGADPTDLLALRELRRSAGVADLRLFLAPRGAVLALIDRVLPPGDAEYEVGSEMLLALAGARLQRDLVLETDPRRLQALQRLDAIEDGTTEFASDPDQVAWLLGSAPVRRLLIRADLQAVVAPYLASWRRLRPDLRLVTLSSYGLGNLPAVEPRRMSDFHLGLLRFLLLNAETREVEARIRAWRATDLARAVALRLGLASDQVETVVLGSLFLEIESLEAYRKLAAAVGGGTGPGKRFALARAMIQAFDAPYDLESLLQALEHRLGGGGPIGAHLGAEVVYTVRHVVRRRQAGQDDIAAILGDNATHHAPRVVRAVATVLRWEPLHTARSARSEPDAHVLVAVREPAMLAALELQLERAGFAQLLAASGQEVLQMAQRWRPACVVADLQLPRMGGEQLLEGLRGCAETAAIPVFFLAEPSAGALGARVLEAGAEDVLGAPVDTELLVAKIRRIVQQPGGQPGAPGLAGQLAQLPLPDLLQTLSLGGRTATVRIAIGDHIGLVGLEGGQLSHASLPGQEGVSALQTLVAAEEGSFSVNFGPATPARNLSGSTEWLLLEALRKADEGG
ncbi:MAG: DUF4388 domain-containing protein [Pseudomonadota bacterium]